MHGSPAVGAQSSTSLLLKPQQPPTMASAASSALNSSPVFAAYDDYNFLASLADPISLEGLSPPLV